MFATESHWLLPCGQWESVGELALGLEMIGKVFARLSGEVGGMIRSSLRSLW